MPTRIHFHDLPHSKRIKEEFEKLADELREDFPEVIKIEVRLGHSSEELETLVRISGKNLELTANATRRDLRASLLEGFERIRRQLRRHRDKVIQTGRREATKISKI